MLLFDPADPYPLLGESVSYAEEKSHAAEVDQWLGFRMEEVEASLGLAIPGQERWESKGPSTFLTPYTELRNILTQLDPAPASKMVDLGAGYGRMAFVIEAHFPELSFLGYELAGPRVAEARRVFSKNGLKRSEMIEADLLQIVPEAAPYYFLYDYGTRAAVEKTLADLQKISRSRAIVLVGRGRAVRDAVEKNHPWLGEVVVPVHFANYSIYRSSEL